jgi:hypothetical protein
VDLVIWQGFAKPNREEVEEVEGEGCARVMGADALPSPTIYRGKGEGAPALDSPPRGAALGGGLPPKPRGRNL